MSFVTSRGRRAVPATSICIWLVSLLPGCSDNALDHSVELRVAADEALANGNTELAIEKFSDALEASPDVSTYYQRGRLYAELGRDAEAESDCALGLELDPNNEELLWLRKQLKLPPQQRFSNDALPPTYVK